MFARVRSRTFSCRAYFLSSRSRWIQGHTSLRRRVGVLSCLSAGLSTGRAGPLMAVPHSRRCPNASDQVGGAAAVPSPPPMARKARQTARAATTSTSTGTGPGAGTSTTQPSTRSSAPWSVDTNGAEHCTRAVRFPGVRPVSFVPPRDGTRARALATDRAAPFGACAHVLVNPCCCMVGGAVGVAAQGTELDGAGGPDSDRGHDRGWTHENKKEGRRRRPGAVVSCRFT